ncbi:NAD(P)-binding domain protein [Raphanus sativus]|nr:NAD(P)-binding domain protein [Raphanus sativus]
MGGMCMSAACGGGGGDNSSSLLTHLLIMLVVCLSLMAVCTSNERRMAVRVKKAIKNVTFFSLQRNRFLHTQNLPQRSQTRLTISSSNLLSSRFHLPNPRTLDESQAHEESSETQTNFISWNIRDRSYPSPSFRNKSPNEINVLVVGSTGYIGRFVVKELVKRGFNVIAVAREKSGVRGKNDKEEFKRRDG